MNSRDERRAMDDMRTGTMPGQAGVMDERKGLRAFLSLVCQGNKDKMRTILRLICSCFSLFMFLTLPGSFQYLAFSILHGCNINKFAHDQDTTLDIRQYYVSDLYFFDPTLCFQVPAIVIDLTKPRALSVETFKTSCNFLWLFCFSQLLFPHSRYLVPNRHRSSFPR